MSPADRLTRLERERDLARQVAEEAMRMLDDGQLAEMRERLDKGEGDDSECGDRPGSDG